MDRRHAEDAFAGELEARHLQHHRDGFHHEHAAHHQQHDFLAHDHRNATECGTHRQRADVTHEHLRRIRVEPQEPEPRASQCTAEDRQLARARDRGNAEVLGKHLIAGQIREHAERSGNQHGRHDGQAVQTVGKVHRIGEPDDHEIGHHHEKQTHRQHDVLEQRHVQRGLGDRQIADRMWRAVIKENCCAETEHRLPEILPAAGQPTAVLQHQLAVVVVETDRTKRQHHRQHHPYIAVLQVGPQQGGDADREQDHHAAHGRRTGLHQMRLRAITAYDLAGLERTQFADQRRTQQQRHGQRCERRHDGAEGDVLEQMQRGEMPCHPVGQFKQHEKYPPLACGPSMSLVSTQLVSMQQLPVPCPLNASP